MTDTPPPFCPHLSQGQIVSFGLAGLMVPHSEAEIATESDLNALGAGLKGRHPTSRGGIDLSKISSMTKRYPRYQLDLSAKMKTPAGTDPADPDPVLIPSPTLIPCQGPQCAFWCAAHGTCREVCNGCRAQTFVDALATHEKVMAAKAASTARELDKAETDRVVGFAKDLNHQVADIASTFLHQPGQNVPPGDSA